MEKYSKAVSVMYSQFKRDRHPMEKYIGRHVVYRGKPREIVGYSTESDGSCRLIIDASRLVGWSILRPTDVVFKECKMYLYASIDKFNILAI